MNDIFKCIYKILRTLEKALDYEKFYMNEICSERLGISKSRWLKYMEMLADAGYIKNIEIKQYIYGDCELIDDGIQITLKGLEYLSENTIMQRIFSAAMAANVTIPVKMNSCQSIKAVKR